MGGQQRSVAGSKPRHSSTGKETRCIDWPADEKAGSSHHSSISGVTSKWALKLRVSHPSCLPWEATRVVGVRGGSSDLAYRHRERSFTTDNNDSRSRQKNEEVDQTTSTDSPDDRLTYRTSQRHTGRVSARIWTQTGELFNDQGRLRHLNDGANAPWKKGGRFLQELSVSLIVNDSKTRRFQ